VEFSIVTLQRSLDLARNYEPVQVGNLLLGLQTIQDDVAEIEIQGPDDLSKISIAVGTAAQSHGYTFIARDVGVAIPKEKKRFRLFGGGKEDIPEGGIMEAVLDVRWGDQSLHVDDPEDNMAYDFMLVRQYESISDRPYVYNNQDTLVFGELALQLGPRVEEGSRNYKKPKYAEFRVKLGDDDEELWQVKLDREFHRKGKYRLMVTGLDIYNGWYQAVGISVAEGRVRDFKDETERQVSSGISSSDVGGAEISRTRLQEAEDDPNEAVMKAGDTVNIGKVGIKLMELKPGTAKIMLLSPKLARTTLEHGVIFDFGKYDVSLVGVHGDKAIIRIVEED
jgi:hypothetical protein